MARLCMHDRKNISSDHALPGANPGVRVRTDTNVAPLSSQPIRATVRHLSILSRELYGTVAQPYSG